MRPASSRRSIAAPRPRSPDPCSTSSRDGWLTDPGRPPAARPGAGGRPRGPPTDDAIEQPAAETVAGYVAVVPDTGAILPQDHYTYAVPDHLATLAVRGARVE